VVVVTVETSVFVPPPHALIAAATATLNGTRKARFDRICSISGATSVPYAVRMSSVQFGLEGEPLQKLRETIGQRRGIARGALLWLEAAAAIATVTAIGIGVINHFTSTGDAKFPGEGKRVVAFRQIANRICTENQDNLRRALAQGRSRVERLGFVARAVGWDVNDLESITPPPTRFDAFLAEITARKQARPEILALQRSVELEDQSQGASAIAALEALEAESRELSRESGTVRCVRILPPIRRLIG
jgi:hypothetical protein